MAQTCDLILTGGTIVNQDGEGVRDVAVTNCKFACNNDPLRGGFRVQ